MESTKPLLPISSNPSNTIRSRCVSILALVHLIIQILTLVLGALTLLCIFMPLSLQPPKVQLDSLFMSEFTISDATLGANWDATLTIDNPNLVTSVRFNHIKGSISYNNTLVAISSVEPFVLGYKQRRIIRVNISTKVGLEEEIDRDQMARVLDDIMRRQRRDGTVPFSLQMFVWAAYRTGWWGTQDVVMSPQCLDLKVGFLPGIGFGSWISRGPMTCSVPILID